MRSLIVRAGCCALALALASVASGQDKQWTTITGQVVYPANKPVPPRNPLNVNVDKVACLAKGPILDESAIVNPKNRGVKNVVVFLRPNANDAKASFKAEEIHPADAKRKAADVVIDQPCCMFVSRVTCARVGDTIVVKNPAAVVHNFFWDSANNGAHNPNIPGKQNWRMPKPLVEERTPIQYKCTVHPWMTGYVRIFDHPYFAVTDDDGKFEIKNAPAGNYRIVFWHESGVKGGAPGRFGEPIKIEGKTLEMKPTEFEVK
jgi:hypothetical protein